jgi:hypothetical protein
MSKKRESFYVGLAGFLRTVGKKTTLLLTSLAPSAEGREDDIYLCVSTRGKKGVVGWGGAIPTKIKAELEF